MSTGRLNLLSASLTWVTSGCWTTIRDESEVCFSSNFSQSFPVAVMNVSQVLSCKNIDEIKRFFRSQLYVCLPQLYVFSFWSQRRAYAPLWFPHNNHLVGFQQTSRFAFKISQIKMVRLPVEWTSALIQSAGRSKTLYKTCHIHIRGSVSSIYDVQLEEPSDYYMTRSTS